MSTTTKISWGVERAVDIPSDQWTPVCAHRIFDEPEEPRQLIACDEAEVSAPYKRTYRLVRITTTVTREVCE